MVTTSQEKEKLYTRNWFSEKVHNNKADPERKCRPEHRQKRPSGPEKTEVAASEMPNIYKKKNR